MNISVRLAIEQDLEEITGIFNQAIQSRTATGYLDEFTVEERKEWFHEHTNEKYPIYVAEYHKKIVGWISISPYRKGRDAFAKTVEVSFFIHNQFKRKGIGGTLLQMMLDEAKKIGYTTMIAIVFDKNNASIRLLKKNDFEQWAFLPEVAEIDKEKIGHKYYGRKL